MTYSFRPASTFTDRHGLFVALVGAPNSGKTFSALRLARGIAGPTGKIAVLDTEGGRTLHLKKDFDFDVRLLEPPHRPARFLEAAVEAQDAGYDVLVIDSFASAWRGVGGTLDWIDEELDLAVERARASAARSNWEFDEGKARYSNKAASSIRPKMAWKLMIAGFLALRIPVIFAIRGELTFNPDTKKDVFKAQVQKNFLFEVTVSFRLSTDKRGAIDLSQPDLYKMEKDHKAIFKGGDLISETHGAALAAWARGEGAQTTAVPQPPQAGQGGSRKVEPGEVLPAGSHVQMDMATGEARVIEPAGPDGWPILSPRGDLLSMKDDDQWVRACLKAIGALEDRDALDGWITAMRVHFDTLHPFNADAVQHVRKAAGDRRVAMIEAEEQGA